jgi:hypothetical protein
MLGYLTGYQVVFVIAGYGDKHFSPAGSCFSQRGCLTPVTVKANAANFAGNSLADAGIPFYNQNFMPFIKQGFG